jgi:hypothetical protein
MIFCGSIKCLPLQLTAELKERRVDASQELLKRFETGGDGLLGELLRKMKTKSTATSRKPRKRARRSAIPGVGGWMD